jgi:hypothetical protein
MNARRKIAAVLLAMSVAASSASVAACATGTDTTTGATAKTTTTTTTPPAKPDGTTPSGTPPTGAPGSTSNFTDVSATAWYAKYVSFVTMKGVMSGVTSTTFQPSAKITRAAFIEALYKAAGSPAVTAKTTLTDVSSSASYYKAVCWAQSVGITNGSGGKFLPSAALTREMAAAFLYRGLSALKLTAVTGGTLTGYTDSGKVSGWARTAMATLVKMGLMNGTAAKTLNPKSSLTRAETAALLYRVLGGDSQSAAPGGSSSGTSSTGSNGTAAETLNSAVTTASKTYASSAADQNALRIDGASVTLTSPTVTKTGDTTSQDNSNFYGDNAGILATNGATATITGANITTSASGGNAVFSYGSGTTVNISDSTITTTKDNSGGIQTAGGGTTNASNLTVSTAGSSAAAIRSDRGGGTVNVDGGTYATSGSGSPAVYSTAAIAVRNATLNATNSEAIVVEGKNSVALTDCTVTGNMTGTYNDSTENIHNIMIYQSMSGDADVGTASFSASGGSITAKQGDMFYVTNTSCTIDLKNVALTLANGTLLTVAGNNSSRGWGTSGKNGGTVAFTADSQTLTGSITCDKISSLTFKLTNGSVYTGAINTSGQGGTVNVTVNSGCTWNLTGDCYVTTLSNLGTINFNGHTIHLADGSTLTA